MSDYRLQFVYDDASASEKYASTQADVVNLISHEVKKCNDNLVMHKILTVHIAYIWKP